MEKKKLHRMVGILILIAVVIIVLPLITGRNQSPDSTTLSLDAPVFPENATPPSTSVQSTEPTTPPSESMPISVPNQSSDQMSPPPKSANMQPDVNPPSAELSEMLTPESIPPTSAPTTSSAQVVRGVQHDDVQQGPVAAISIPTPSKKQQPAPVTAPPLSVEEKPTVPATKPSDTTVGAKNGRVSHHKAFSSVWAVQMGHFHNHVNAVRLASRLRSIGFKAFTRQIVSRDGVVSTRVYVGPEQAEASAHKSSHDIYSRVHMNGMVVPYEPLAI